MHEFNMDDSNYAFDLNKILSFINNNSLSKETEIVDLYEMDSDGNPKITSKQTRELKNNSVDQTITIKYDLIKTLLSVILNDEDTNYLANNIAFNTMLVNEFIYKI